MLIEIAIGDAYGGGFEFAKPERLAELKNDLSQYYPHNLPGHLPAGSYTDDTQMSIALAEHILDGSPWTHKALADRFVDTYKRDPRNGYSRRFQKLLDQVQNGDELRTLLVPKSDRCGAAMRSCPIGIYKDEWHVVEFARKQATLTHDTKEGIHSSVAIALSCHFLLHKKGTRRELIGYLNKHSLTRDFFEDGELWPVGQRVSSEAIPCVKAAISSVVRCDSYSELLKECIDYTGDVDSVAAMAMGVASCSFISDDKITEKLDRFIPTPLISGLENNDFGFDYLLELDRKLLADWM